MFNVSTKVVGTKLQIEVDLTKEKGLSTSGKTILVASTEGNSKILEWKQDEMQFGLNVYKKPRGDGTPTKKR